MSSPMCVCVCVYTHSSSPPFFGGLELPVYTHTLTKTHTHVLCIYKYTHSHKHTHTHLCPCTHIHTSEATISILDRMTKPEFRPSIAGNLVCVFVCICLFVEHFFCLMFSCLFVTDPLRKSEIFEKYKRIMKYSRSYFPRTYKYKYLHSLRRARGSHYSRTTFPTAPLSGISDMLGLATRRI